MWFAKCAWVIGVLIGACDPTLCSIHVFRCGNFDIDISLPRFSSLACQRRCHCLRAVWVCDTLPDGSRCDCVV